MKYSFSAALQVQQKTITGSACTGTPLYLRIYIPASWADCEWRWGGEQSKVEMYKLSIHPAFSLKWYELKWYIFLSLSGPQAGQWVTTTVRLQRRHLFYPVLSLNLVTSRAANFKTSRIDTDMTLLGLFYVFQVSILNCSDDGQSRMCVSETGRDP